MKRSLPAADRDGAEALTCTPPATPLPRQALTQQQGFELVRLRNFWPCDQYKGISSLWRDPAAGQLFEVQFHTEVSYYAMVFTAEHTYARLRSARTGAPEELALEAFQREVYAHVPVRRARTASPAARRTRAGRSREGGPAEGRTG